MCKLNNFSRFRKRLFAFRKARFSDAAEMAELIGVNEKKYRSFENNSGPLPNMEEIISICKVLGNNELFRLWLLEYFKTHSFYPIDVCLIEPIAVEEAELAQIVVSAHKELNEAKEAQEDLFMIAADNRVTGDEVSRLELAMQEFEDLFPVVNRMRAWKEKYIKKEAACAAR